MLVASTRRYGALALLGAALAACTGPDEGGEIDPEATVEVPTGEVGPAPVVGDSIAGADSGVIAIPDSMAAGH